MEWNEEQKKHSPADAGHHRPPRTPQIRVEVCDLTYAQTWRVPLPCACCFVVGRHHLRARDRKKRAAGTSDAHLPTTQKKVFAPQPSFTHSLTHSLSHTHTHACVRARASSTPRRPPRPPCPRTRRRPPRSPSRARQGPHGPRRTRPPPYPHRRTSARRRACCT